jgi:hypothetical protein
MNVSDPEFNVEKIVRKLELSSAARTGCQSDPERAAIAIVMGWEVLTKFCVPTSDAWRLRSHPSRGTMLRELQGIYSTNWPNRRICQTLRCLYEIHEQDWQEVNDIRALLDLAVWSALEGAFGHPETNSLKDVEASSE